MKVKLFDFALEPRAGAERLYFRAEGFTAEAGGLYAERTAVKVSFDTYFNLVPVGKFKKYCDISSVIFDISADGEYIAEVVSFDGESETVSASGTSLLTVDMSAVPDNALYLYLRLAALSDRLRINKISVYAEGEKVHDVNPAIVICTYRREEYAVRNAQLLAESADKDNVQGQIIIVDNGRTLKDFDNPRITLIPNENTGGSGGFAKGMEYAAQGDFTHVILMDDDVSFEYVSFQKLFGFLRLAKDEDISVSGTMLFEDKPTVCFESGGYFDVSDGSQKGCCYGLDMTDKNNLAVNEQEKQINYGGWWMMCMPIRYAKGGQFPLPLFIKYDDVEYALRCKLNIITLSGVGVWHEGFEHKYNSDSEYYNTRNYLLLRSLHGGLTAKQAKRIAKRSMLEKLCRQQYNMAQAVVTGYRDFLKGTEYLKTLDAADNHAKVRELNYEMLTENELFERYGVRFSAEKLDRSEKIRFKRYMQPLLYGQLIPNVFCKKDYTVTDTFLDRKEMYFRYSKALHFDRRTGRGYVTEKSLKTMLPFLLKRKF